MAVRRRGTKLSRSTANTQQQIWGQEQEEKQQQKHTERYGNMVQSKWLTLALASGMFAALNGLFAKLTTTELTTSIARAISHLFSASSSSSPPTTADTVVEYIVRATFFGLNILSNIIMWALFTRALTASPSTTKVAITNTTANFLVTAVLGMVVFRELVGGLWWLGAVLMASGCILVGMREEEKADEAGSGSSANTGNGAEGIRLTGDSESSDEDEDSQENDDLLSFREH